MTHTKICDLPSDMTGIPDCDNEIKANAALIAAAPDMLKALKDSVMLLEMFGRVLERDIKAGDNIDAEIYQRIVNAIKLAKGEPQP